MNAPQNFLSSYIKQLHGCNKNFAALLCLLFFSGASAQDKDDYKVIKTFHIASRGGWDYIAVNNRKLYVSHGTQVNILNEFTGDSIGVIPNTNGVHGIAFDNELNKGFTSNGRSNNVTIFDLTQTRFYHEYRQVKILMQFCMIIFQRR